MQAGPISRFRACCTVHAPSGYAVKSSYEPTNATDGRSATAAPIMPRPRQCVTFAASVATMLRPNGQRASAGTLTPRCAESSIAIELVQMNPSTVNRIRRPVQPDSLCARTRALTCSYDTTAATVAALTTTSAVDHLMTRSVAFITHRRRPARTPP